MDLFSPSTLRKKEAKLKKIQEKKERNKSYYKNNRADILRKANERKKNRLERKCYINTRRSVKAVEQSIKCKEEKKKARQEKKEKRDKLREQNRARVRKYREAKKKATAVDEIVSSSGPKPGYKNRMAKKRGVDKVRNVLPGSPVKKAEIIQTLVESPRTRKVMQDRGLIKTPEEQKETTALKALASDIAEGLQHVKRSGSKENRAAYEATKSLAFGRNVKKSRAKKCLSKLVNVNEKSISKAIKRREKVLKGKIPNWLYTKRKIRCDAVSEEDARTVYDYWTNVASRPTGDKKDGMKKRIGKQKYIYHAKHVLEKTQTEAYLDFCVRHPEVNIKQRKFEGLKPFFIKQARERDRKSCLCRKHVEIKLVFNDCMKFRKKLLKDSNNQSVPIPTSVTEAVEMTLCLKEEGKRFHRIECLQRECPDCGVNKFKLLQAESSREGSVRWARYEYVSTGKQLPNGQEKKKIALVQKKTPPLQMFQYFQELLKSYPSHAFMARWQREQLDSLIDDLPQGHTVCVHDYSEGYTCRKQDEIQSEYFDINKVSLHVTILYRHALEAVDGIQSTEDEPCTIKEHIFVISDDPGQDHDSVHKVQELINRYFSDIGLSVNRLHEFTDGCAGQYKSRHCVGELSCSLADFGYNIQRSYFETSHAKGEQDAAGSHIKQRVSQAVLQRKATISDAKSMHEYLSSSFTLPAASSFGSRQQSVQLKRRVFFHVPSSGENAVQRNRPGRQFKSVSGIRKWHCVKSLPQQEKVLVRFRTCYCTNCLMDDEEKCLNKEWLDNWKEVNIEREPYTTTTRQTTDTTAVDTDTACHIADLATRGSTVAIAAYEDPVYDFYLLQVTSEGVEELQNDMTDDYLSEYPRGSNVLKGHFFLRENLHDMTYTLDTNRLAVVYAATVRLICSELSVNKRNKRKHVYKLSLVQHEEIIASL